MKLSEGLASQNGRLGSTTMLREQNNTNLSGILNMKGDHRTIDLSREPQRRDIPIVNE